GVLSSGFRLPTVRQLAADLGLAPNTVARVYRELEFGGLIETRGRHGSFVTGVPSPSRALAVEAAQQYVRRVTQLGLAAAESLAIVRREIEQPTTAYQSVDARPC
ncbi:MAG: hypothetical protein QOK02_4761, partial [Mycobacterium sp.]|nr:hypothetical protein [Mycobacterium sp.]